MKTANTLSYISLLFMSVSLNGTSQKTYIQGATSTLYMTLAAYSALVTTIGVAHAKNITPSLVAEGALWGWSAKILAGKAYNNPANTNLETATLSRSVTSSLKAMGYTGSAIYAGYQLVHAYKKFSKKPAKMLGVTPWLFLIHHTARKAYYEFITALSYLKERT